MAAAARRFCGAIDAFITLREGNEFVIAAHDGALGVVGRHRRPLDRATVVGRAILDGQTVHFPTIDDSIRSSSPRREPSPGHGFRAALVAPMLREGIAIGGIVLRKPEPGPFTPRQIELLETFAAQAVIAIENVRLFTEIQEKSRQLEIASQHKSQFLANMSHELRTPLNAIIGYTEMMADGLYGDVPEKAQGVLERVQNNGRHLLGLINDVLDLSKIEAGQLALAIEEYSVADMVATVLSATKSLARAKGLTLGSDDRARPADRHRRCAATDPGAAQPGRQCHQVHRPGRRSRSARVQAGERFELSVVDTGLGIAPGRPGARSSTSSSRSTTPARARRAAPGSASRSRARSSSCMAAASPVESEVGKGSTFTVTIPVHAAPVKEAAQ